MTTAVFKIVGSKINYFLGKIFLLKKKYMKIFKA